MGVSTVYVLASVVRNIRRSVSGWLLVRMKNAWERTNWLLIKHRNAVRRIVRVRRDPVRSAHWLPVLALLS